MQCRHALRSHHATTGAWLKLHCLASRLACLCRANTKLLKIMGDLTGTMASWLHCTILLSSREEPARARNQKDALS
eukprot:3316443-Amphidinium_carterae.2